MICLKCGREVKEGVACCAFCGRSTAEKTLKRRWLLSVAVAVLLTVGIAGAVSLLWCRDGDIEW